MWKMVFAAVVFLLGLYVLLHYGTRDVLEPFQPRCPNLLIQKGDEIWLKNTNLAEIPGVNPVVFHNLEEYTQFIAWQQSRGIECPALMLQRRYDAQNNEVFNMVPPPSFSNQAATGDLSLPMPPVTPLLDSTRDNPPFNRNSYPGMDPSDQTVGENTALDVYGRVGETQDQSPNAMDANWGGVSYSKAAVDAGNYVGDEVYKYAT
jgi:hypothetical protein